jgi:hypothetical protein
MTRHPRTGESASRRAGDRMLAMTHAILAIASLTIAASAVAAPIPATPFLPIERAADFKPFAIKSTKLGKTLSSAELEAKYLCRPTSEVIESSKQLLENFDVVNTGRDGTLGWVAFKGEQEGKPATVTIMVSAADQIVKIVLVNGRPALGCDHQGTYVNGAGVRVRE